MAGFRGLPQELELPSAPQHPILFMDQPDRPQPARDVWLENGMATLVGRLRSCPVLDYRMVIMGHNTVRGAAGAAVLNAEAMYRLGLLGCGEDGRFNAAEMKRRAGLLNNATIREMVCSE
jgi:aspartate-semialdehyde dehydrogenase